MSRLRQASQAANVIVLRFMPSEYRITQPSGVWDNPYGRADTGRNP
jgi:hypothetical protein